MKELLKLNPPAFLIVTTTLGFFALVVLLFFHELPMGTKDILQVLLGGVLGQWTAMVQYHFGSSSGSAAKSATLEKLTGTGDGGQQTVTSTVKTDTQIKTETPPKEGATP